MVNGVEFVLNLVPILIGLAIFLALKIIDYNTKKISIADESDSEIKEAIGPPLHSDLRAAFLELAKDELILNGISEKNRVEKTAFEKINLLPFWNIKHLISAKAKNSLLLFANEGQLEKLIKVYSPACGIILAYLLNDSLRLIKYE
ncbi:MAG: hypothetical protein ACP5P2_00345 [Candidatus Micrarchaeia archaeon]|jgi:hypothetical protein